MTEPERPIEIDGSRHWIGWDFGWLIVSGLLGLGLRLVYVLEYAGHPIGRLPWVDEGAFLTRALEIVGGRWLPSRPYYQDPLFPYALALLIRVVGASVSTLRVVLACLGTLTPAGCDTAWKNKQGSVDNQRGKTWCHGSMAFTMIQTVATPNSANWTYCSGTTSGSASTFSESDSYHPGGVNVLFGDGSVHFIKNTINRTVWWALGTKGSGEIISADTY